ncbi:histidine kinase [Nonlabens sp. SY33080]|uniref:sensor histidine kinase n=1 Tax=Nonlabens sp. SY33080 TaxID=2719911 RepID=UPI0014289DB9|nr:histidine kinase [Nonlabens sp. SY33080]
MKIYNLLYFIIALSSNLIFGQQEVYHHFSRNDQLPDATFYDIIEDDHFNIWLAADSGLYKYNGKQFILYTHPDQHGDAVFNLTLDHKGRLWFNNIYGQFFYVENEQMTLFHDAHDIVNGQLVPFSVDEDNVIIYNRSGGIYHISKSSKEKTLQRKDRVLTTTSRGEEIWHLDIPIDDSTDQIHKIIIESNNESTVVDEFNREDVVAPSLFEANNSIFLTYKLKGGNKLYTIDKDQPLKEISIPETIQKLNIYNITGHHNELWLCTSDGIWVCKKNGQTLEIFDQLLESQSISEVITDFNKNQWATTLDNGIFVIPNKEVTRKSLPEGKQKITAVTKVGDDHFALGTDVGTLYLYNTDLSLKYKLDLNDKNNISFLYHDTTEHTLLISISSNLSYKLDLDTFKLTPLKSVFNSAKSIERLNDQFLFYGNFKEALLYDSSLIKENAILIRKNRVKDALVIDENKLLISFVDGLYLYNLASSTLREIKYGNESVFATSLSKIDDEIWVGIKDNKVLKSVIIDDGLRFRESVNLNLSKNKNQTSTSLTKLRSDQQHLWMLNEGVITRYDLTDDSVQEFNGQMGMNELINEYLLYDDLIISTSIQALYRIPKYAFTQALKTAPIEITDVKINSLSLVLKENYNLKHDRNNISIAFNSNGFQSREYVAYEYQLVESNKQWISIPVGNTQVDFASLSPGTYTFKLRGKNCKSDIYKYAGPVTFSIEPPFWQTPWFYFLIAVGIAGATFFILKQLQKRKNKQRKIEIDRLLLEKKMASLKLENIRSQMNPHFVFNSLNSIQDFIVSNERELASDYLVKFSRLIRKYLDYSQQDEITLGQEIAALKLYLELEKMRFDDELDYSIKIDDTLNIEHIMIPSLLVQPYVENALKHGLMHKPSNRKLMIDCGVIKNEKILSIKIEDNGIGRQQSALLNRNRGRSHTSFSTAVNNERALLYKEQFNKPVDIVIEDLVNDGQASGTRVTITLPLN